MIPVILVTGFLGSGKTTFLKSFAENHPNLRMVFLVNELSEISVDGKTLEQTGLPSHSVVGGSLFCECKASDFVRIMKTSIVEMNEQSSIDAILIETSGIADPEAIGQLFVTNNLNDWFEVQRIVTVVSPKNLPKLVKNLPVITNQIKSSDVVVVNKIDLASEQQLSTTLSTLHKIAPHAEILKSTYCNVAFDAFVKRESGLPMGQLTKCSANPFTTHYVDLSHLKVDLKRFKTWASNMPESMLRLKGYVNTQQGWISIEQTIDNLTIQKIDEQSESHLVFIVHDNHEGELDKILEDLQANNYQVFAA